MVIVRQEGRQRRHGLEQVSIVHQRALQLVKGVSSKIHMDECSET